MEKPHQDLNCMIVSRERVVAPPDRFIAVDDSTLVDALQGLLKETSAHNLSALQELIQGIVTHDLLKVRRSIEHDLGAFGTTNNEVGKVHNTPELEAANLDDYEQGKLEELVHVIRACRYTILTKSEWEAAMAENFLLTLPVTINWEALDDKLLKRYWETHPEIRAELGEEYADRALIFHRGIKVAHMEGYYYDLKIDALLSFYVLQPLWALLAYLAKLVGMEKYLMAAPPGIGMPQGGVGADRTEALHSEFRKGNLHENTISIERQTLARALKDGRSTLRSFFRKIRLQEACFQDVIIIYRRGDVPKSPPNELDIINDDDMDIKRNLIIRHFSGIPLADMEMILPDKNIFLPAMLTVQLMITAITGLFAFVSAFLTSDKLHSGLILSSFILLGTRAYQIYSSALFRRTTMEKQMYKVLFEHSTAAQEMVVSSLTDEMIKQHTRELLICYCILLSSTSPLSAESLDKSCEDYLKETLSISIDFTTELALSTLEEWHLVDKTANGQLKAVALETALEKLDALWDDLFDFKDTCVGYRPSGLVGVPADLLGVSEDTQSAADRVFKEEPRNIPESEEAPRPPAVPDMTIPEEPRKHRGGASRSSLFHRIRNKISKSK